MAPVKDKRMAEDESRAASIAVTDGPAIPLKKDVGLFTAWRIAFFGAISTHAHCVQAVGPDQQVVDVVAVDVCGPR